MGCKTRFGSSLKNLIDFLSPSVYNTLKGDFLWLENKLSSGPTKKMIC